MMHLPNPELQKRLTQREVVMVDALVASRYWSTRRLAQGPGIRSRGQNAKRPAATGAKSRIKQCQCGLFRSCIAQHRQPRSFVPSELHQGALDPERPRSEETHQTILPRLGKPPLRSSAVASLQKSYDLASREGQRSVFPGKLNRDISRHQSGFLESRQPRARSRHAGSVCNSAWSEGFPAGLWALVASGIWISHIAITQFASLAN
jgi:hypothetical protein